MIISFLICSLVAYRADRVQPERNAMQAFLAYILQAYEMQGIRELAPSRISDFLQIRYGGTNDAKRKLGSVGVIRGAFLDIQKHLFQQTGENQ
ncbi:hypothetical protein QQX03_03515 [Altererythrobacter rubellus]|jgi:type I restriction enzyme R subunit|uniref:EcoEI R protein C-terminal domain-containing protein n=1 Tax=Altererythrobacter rubellus TaxID=2173831 RepID=A0A9Y2B951_9SPHN|nr:hypothetical protein [Altererythrobacter rubellus]WIW96186.1 hypothetical protein QQX03_03515 [Altererythrobacter rubellus]